MNLVPKIPLRWGEDRNWSQLRDHLFKVALAINTLMEGTSNSNADLTFGASVLVTTLVDERIGGESRALLIPLTASAAAVIGSVWQTAVKGTITFNHSSSAATDMRFGVVLKG